MRHNKDMRRHNLFKQGKKKVEKELDIASVLRTIRTVRHLKKIIFDKTQRRFLQYQKADFIESDSDKNEQTDIDMADEFFALGEDGGHEQQEVQQDILKLRGSKALTIVDKNLLIGMGVSAGNSFGTDSNNSQKFSRNNSKGSSRANFGHATGRKNKIRRSGA
jgi:hypothetical protein